MIRSLLCLRIVAWLTGCSCDVAAQELFGSTSTYDASAVWEGCREACPDRVPIGFRANTSKARALYQGCEKVVSEKFLQREADGFPAVIVVGTQKGGTTFLKNMFKAVPGFCFLSNEGHFWDRWRHSQNPVSEHVVRLDYLSIWEKCPAGAARMEKTPELTVMGWVPLRLCQSLPSRQRLMMMLRNPVNRAYSGFNQVVQKLAKSGIRQTAKHFDLLAHIEVDLVRECESMPTGDPAKDAVRAIGYKSCCETVARRHTSLSWPGCECNTQNPSGKTCNHFGSRNANVIRRGIYSHFIKLYLTYHRAEDLLIYRSEDFFSNPNEAFKEVACFARPSVGCDTQPSLIKSKHSAIEGIEPIWPSTERFLKEFYEPYNKELEELIGRKMLWW